MPLSPDRLGNFETQNSKQTEGHKRFENSGIDTLNRAIKTQIPWTLQAPKRDQNQYDTASCKTTDPMNTLKKPRKQQISKDVKRLSENCFEEAISSLWHNRPRKILPPKDPLIEPRETFLQFKHIYRFASFAATDTRDQRYSGVAKACRLGRHG